MTWAWRTVISFSQRAAVVLFFAVFDTPAFAQTGSDPDKLIEQAERLSWVKAWARAAPLYAEAERLYAARGDRRNALYAQINHLRGQLPRLPVP